MSAITVILKVLVIWTWFIVDYQHLFTDHRIWRRNGYVGVWSGRWTAQTWYGSVDTKWWRGTELSGLLAVASVHEKRWVFRNSCSSKVHWTGTFFGRAFGLVFSRCLLAFGIPCLQWINLKLHQSAVFSLGKMNTVIFLADMGRNL